MFKCKQIKSDEDKIDLHVTFFPSPNTQHHARDW